jgi:hypothetical protein
LVDLWNNSDLEFSQKVNAQNGTSTSGLQKTGCEKFALKLHSFFNEAPRGDRLPICPFEKGTRWARILVARNNAQGVAPASTKYLSSALSCGCQFLLSHSWMGQANKEHDEKKLSGATPGGRCCFSFPMRMLGLRPYWEGVEAKNRIAICSFRTAQAKCF